MCLLLMPDCWLDVSVRKVLRPAISTQVFFLGFPVSLKQMLRWFPSPICHYMLLMYPSRCKFSSTASSSCICVKNDCHRVKTQSQLNKYYYYYYYYYYYNANHWLRSSDLYIALYLHEPHAATRQTHSVCCSEVSIALFLSVEDGALPLRCALSYSHFGFRQSSFSASSTRVRTPIRQSTWSTTQRHQKRTTHESSSTRQTGLQRHTSTYNCVVSKWYSQYIALWRFGWGEGGGSTP